MTLHDMLCNVIFILIIWVIFYTMVIRDYRRDRAKMDIALCLAEPGSAVSVNGLRGTLVRKGTLKEPFLVRIAQDLTVEADIRALTLIGA